MAENHHLECTSSQTARTCQSPQKRMDFFCAIAIQIYEKNPLPKGLELGTSESVRHLGNLAILSIFVPFNTKQYGQNLRRLQLEELVKALA